MELDEREFKGGAQIRHGSGKDRGYQESGDAVGHVLHDESWINTIRFSKVGRWFLVIGPKHHADN